MKRSSVLLIVILFFTVVCLSAQPIRYTRAGLFKDSAVIEFPNYGEGRNAPEECQMEARSGLTFNQFVAGEKHGSLKVHEIATGNSLAECPIIAFDGSFLHADCDGNGIDPADLTIERISSDLLRMTNVSAVLGPTIPGGVCFDFIATQGFSVTPPAEVRINFETLGSTDEVFKYIGSKVAPFGVAGDFDGGDFTLGVNYTTYLFNPTGLDLTVGYRFRDEDGAPKDVDVNGITGSVFQWTVGPNQSVSWDINSISGLLENFSVEPFVLSGNPGMVYSAEVAGQFRTRFFDNAESNALDVGPAQEDGEIVGDAGLAYSQPGLVHTVAVKKTAEGEDTAVAILNATNSEGTLTLQLRDSDNEVVAQEAIELSGWNFISQFALEYFGLQATTPEFEGSLVIMGNVDTGIVPFNTINGFQTSSLPAGTLTPF